jgi:hypothetical protein
MTPTDPHYHRPFDDRGDEAEEEGEKMAIGEAGFQYREAQLAATAVSNETSTTDRSTETMRDTQKVLVTAGWRQSVLVGEKKQTETLPAAR